MLKIIFLSLLATFANGKCLDQVSSSQYFRIAGGEDTTIENHPYQVAIEKSIGPVCGGSLLQPNIVLTAAHCTQFPASQYSVRAGSSFRGKGGQVAEVISVCNHPKYEQFHYKIEVDYDVSVLLLNDSFILGPKIQLITLQPIGVSVPDDTTIITVTGWGFLKSNESLPDNLQIVNLVKIKDEICQDIYRPRIISERMVCYGDPAGKKDSCQGDSGGPAVANGKQVGIISWGDVCGISYKPGVYTRIENEEIQNHIEKCKSEFTKQ